MLTSSRPTGSFPLASCRWELPSILLCPLLTHNSSRRGDIYPDTGGERVLKFTNGNKVDRVIDVEFGANLNQVLRFIRIGGTIVTYSSTQVKEPKLPFLEMLFMDLTIRMVLVYAMPESAKEKAIADTLLLLETGKLSHRIAYSLSFNEIAKAHQLVERGGCGGCVVVNIDE